MKIVNTSAGIAYQLNPGTQLEVERTNLFFNEYGEQTFPIDLPDTERNRRLLGYPDELGGVNKPLTDISATIQDDGYFMACRQAVLGAERKKGFSTSFYMNEGAFLSKISDISLKEIFGDETIPNITTVQDGINYCRSLVSGTNPDFAIFPVLVEPGETYDNGYPKYKYINRYGYEDSAGIFKDDISLSTSPDFYNSVARSETVNGEMVNLPAGYYMSPFIRGNYLLKRIFQYFGYTLVDNFFTRTPPFTDMVFINNCADALVNGTIRLIDLLPDSMCSTVLEVYRKKFCCEFIPNEENRTVDIKLFNETISQKPQYDLTPYLVSQPDIRFPEKYQQLIISSENQVSDSDSAESPDSVVDLISKYQYVVADPFDGCFYKVGYKYMGIALFSMPYVITIRNKVASSSMRYYEGGNLKTKEIQVPDIQPEFRKVYNGFLSPGAVGFDGWDEKLLYIGSANFLNSKIVVGDSENTNTSKESSEVNSDNNSLEPMLAFFYNVHNYPRGTITNYGMRWSSAGLGKEEYRLWDYSLCYNGDDGIFERFYRRYDEIYRNSLHSVKVSLLLPTKLKQSLPAHLPVYLFGQDLLVNRFKYSIGGKKEPIETELFTIRSYEPVSSAKKFSGHISGEGHTWTYRATATDISKEEYNVASDKERPFETIFPQRPTADLAVPGKKHYLQTSSIFLSVGGGSKYMHIEFWLECI